MKRTRPRAKVSAIRFWKRFTSPYHRWRLERDITHISGPKALKLDPNQAVALALILNEAPLLEQFLDHHFRLGFKHVVLLDNGSTDGTIEIARSYDRVTLLQSTLPYRAHHYEARRYLVDRFGGGCWSLSVDMDERFDYPFSSRIPLDSFLAYLARNRYDAVQAHMLDLFAEGPLSSWPPSGPEMIARCRWYDISDVYEVYPLNENRTNSFPSHRLPHYKGGIRKSAFQIAPNLTKYPLLFRDAGVRPAPDSAHYCRNGRVADLSCLLAHYKFHSRFRETCERAVSVGNYYDASIEYRAYLSALKRSGDIVLKGPNARLFTGPDDLVENGFLTVSAAYRELASLVGPLQPRR